MDTICSAGALYLCLIGNLFDDQILEQEHDIVLYAVLGIKDKVEKIADIIQVHEPYRRQRHMCIRDSR